MTKITYNQLDHNIFIIYLHSLDNIYCITDNFLNFVEYNKQDLKNYRMQIVDCPIILDFIPDSGVATGYKSLSHLEQIIQHQHDKTFTRDKIITLADVDMPITMKIYKIFYEKISQAFLHSTMGDINQYRYAISKLFSTIIINKDEPEWRYVGLTLGNNQSYELYVNMTKSEATLRKLSDNDFHIIYQKDNKNDR